MKCHERWIDLLASVGKAYPELSADANRLLQACEVRVVDSVIDFEIIEHALLELYQLSGDPAFGWKVGWNICLRTQLHRAVTVYLDLQATLGDALMVTQDYPELLVMPGIRYVPRPTLKTIRLHIVSHNYEFKEFGQIAMICMGAILKETRSAAVGFDLTELVVDEALMDEDLLSGYTGAKLKSDKDRFTLGASLSWLKHKKLTADAVLAESIKPILDREVVKLRKQDNLIDTIEKALHSSDHPQQYTLKEFSAVSGMSEASIRRKLAEHKVSFSDLIQNYLRTMAIQYLMDEKETVDSISYQLGFSERAAFERAFKRWYGLSPVQFREQFLSVAELEDVNQSELADIKLEPLPKVVQQALRFMDSPDYSVSGLADIIKADLVLSARLLSMANSAFYGAGKVRDLADAIGRVLGLNRIRNMALTLAIKESFTDKGDDYDMRRMWFCAMFSEQWLEKLRGNINWSFELHLSDFIAGIQFGLIGHLVIARSELEQKAAWCEVVQGDSLLDIVRWEKNHLGMTVFSVSSLLLARWGMSNGICKFLMSISPHVYDEAEDLGLPCAALHLADLVWRSYEYGDIDDVDFQPLAKGLNIEPNALIEAYEATRMQKTELNSMINQLF